jgi:cbb3-type cytochrome oxidase maturation protein
MRICSHCGRPLRAGPALATVLFAPYTQPSNTHLSMNILYLLIPISLVFVAIAIGLFIWAIKSGQYDDLEGPAHRILMDDDDPRIPRTKARTTEPVGDDSDDAKPRQAADEDTAAEASDQK